MALYRDFTSRPKVIQDAPLVAKEHLARARAANAPSATVRVDSAVGMSISARFPRAQGDGIRLLTSIKVAPVVADPRSDFAGLVLAGQDIVVPTERRRSQHAAVALWGAQETFAAMSQEDWAWAVSSAYEAPIPVSVNSRIRNLAYYHVLDVRPGPPGMVTLKRWADAIDKVLEGVDVIEGMYGASDFITATSDRDLDLTVDEALVRGSRESLLSWATQARIVAGAAKGAYAERVEHWLKHSVQDTAEAAAASYQSLIENLPWTQPMTSTQQSFASFYLNGGTI